MPIAAAFTDGEVSGLRCHERSGIRSADGCISNFDGHFACHWATRLASHKLCLRKMVYLNWLGSLWRIWMPCSLQAL